MPLITQLVRIGIQSLLEMLSGIVAVMRARVSPRMIAEGNSLTQISLALQISNQSGQSRGAVFNEYNW